MSTPTPIRPIAGTILFPFEALYIRLENSSGPVFGFTRIAFNGAGAYWPVAITVHSRVYGDPDRPLRHGTTEWREIARRLDQYQADNIKARIREALEERGLHMALFNENPASPSLPPRRPEPAPSRADTVLLAAGRTALVAGRTALGAGRVARDAGTAALELAGLAAMLFAIVCGCFAVEAARAPAHAPHPVLAVLETGDGR